MSESAGLDELLAKTRPRVCFFGHHHTRLDAEVAGVQVGELNNAGVLRDHGVPVPSVRIALQVR